MILKVELTPQTDIKEPPLKQRMDVSYIKTESEIMGRKYLIKILRRKYLIKYHHNMKHPKRAS